MARRRSMNRRWSRRSMLNNTELDDNSEIVDTNDPMWWRHLEGDTTVRQSRRFSSFNNTTAEILNDDSHINRSDLTGEWWKNLDATNVVEPPRRISSRKSVTPVETPNESFNSEKSEDVSIKKRKVMLRVPGQRSDATDNFSKALADFETSKKRKSKNDEKSGTDDSRNELQRKRHRRSSFSETLGKNDDVDSGNTSNDTDIIVKTRPKPFKKRVQSIDHQPFDDILQNEIEELKITADSSKSHDGINLRSSGKFVDEETPAKMVDSELMRPPQRASHQKRMSSISRKLNLTSDESESDGGTIKKRPVFGTKKQTKKSINPFDEILSGHLEEMDEDEANNVGQVNENSFSRSRRTRNKSLSVDPNSRVSPIEPEVLERRNNRSILDASRKSQSYHAVSSGKSSRKRKSTTNEVESPEEVNRGSITTAKNDSRVSSRGVSMGKSYLPENSRSRRMEDTSDNDEGLDTLSKALLGNKKLEVSITRLEPLESSIRIEDESENEDLIESNERIRTLRSASRSRLLADSAYELPDKERSDTPSFSDNDIEGPLQQNLTGRNSRSSRASKSVSETRFSSRTSKTSASLKSMNSSRTKIFSDEDISIENMEDPTNNESKKSLSNETKNSRKNLVEKNKSRKSIALDENISENEMEIQESRRSRNTQLEKSTRFSGKNIIVENNSRNDVETIHFSASNLKEKSSESRKSDAEKLSPIIQSSESIDEDEIENAESSPVPENLVSQKSRSSRKSLAPTNVSQRIEFGSSISEDEMENVEEGPISENSVSPEKSVTSRKSLATSNKSRQFQSDESISEDEIENGQEKSTFENTVLQEKSRSSLANKSRRSGKSIIEDEIEDTENNPTMQQNSDLPEKSHLSGKSFATANKSRRSGKSINENEIEDTESNPTIQQNSDLPEKSHLSGKSFATANKSRRSRKSINEDEIEDTENNPTIQQNSDLPEKSHLSGKSFATANKSRRSGKSINENEIEDTESNPTIQQNSDLPEKSHLSGKSFATANKSRRSRKSIIEDEIENTENNPTIQQNSDLPEKSHLSGKSFATANKSRRSRKSINEDEIEDTENNPTIQQNSDLPEKSHLSGKSVATANKSRRSGKSIIEDEIEDTENNPTIQQNSDLPEKSHLSGKSFATANKSRRSRKSIIEDEIEDTENNPTIQQNSDLPEKSNLSGKSLATANKSRQSKSDKNKSKNENEERGEQFTPENLVLQEKSRTINKSLANKSRQSQSGKNIDEDKIKDGSKKSNLANSILQEKSQTSRKSLATSNKSQKSILSDEDDEEELEESDKMVSVTVEKSQESRKSVANKSRQRILSDDASTENEDAVNPRKSVISNQSRKNVSSGKSIGEARAKGATGTNPKSTFLEEEKTRGKRSEASRRIIKSDDETNETEEAQIQYRRPSHMSLDQREETPIEVSENRDSEEGENEEKQENPSSLRKVEKSRRISRNSPTINKSMTIDDSPFSIRERLNNISRIMPTSTPKISNLRQNDILQKQKTITEFFPSKFLQISDNSRTREPATSFDREKLDIARRKMEEIKKREIEAMKINAPTKKRETNFPKRPENVGTSKNVVTRDNTASKKTKVIDKAYIVNGSVYKRPKLPRPKPWVTDRLYHHLWKLMEPKFKLATRVKSEKFIQQLSEIVALTIRRKKYDSYKIEIDCLMKDMAKLGIIKTRNDFYDFCYDFLPYDFRVKVTPIMLPGNVRSIPYDPEKLHTPIIPEN